MSGCYVTGATLRRRAPDGRGRQHARFNVNSGGARASAVAFGCDGTRRRRRRRAGRRELPARAQRLERRRRAAAGPAARERPAHRLRSRSWASPTTTSRRRSDGARPRPRSIAAPTRARADAELPAVRTTPAASTIVLDRRGESPLATIADAQAAAGADEPRPGDLCKYTEATRSSCRSPRWIRADQPTRRSQDEPELLTEFEHVVVLDPPASETQDAITRLGSGLHPFGLGRS